MIFKKEYKEFCMPKHKPEIITVPPVNWYIAVGVKEIQMKRAVHITAGAGDFICGGLYFEK